MTSTGKAVRVFLSSTFRDMHAERDHLITVVFPELRERLERLGLEFYDVDLRWGVPQIGVDGEQANSWAYCKQWIDRVEPFFVCILGQRYGWVPPAEETRDPEDRAAYAGLSITEMEIRHAVLSGKVRLRSFFYFRTPRVPEDTSAALYREFVDPDDEPRLDALKRLIRGTGRPVRAYDCRWTGQGYERLDAFGRSLLEDLWSGVLRDSRYVSREVWRQVLGHEPDGDPLYSDESRPIPAEVWEEIVKRAKPAPLQPLDAEAGQMATFAAARLRWFQGRGRELRQLKQFVNGDGPAEANRLCVVRAIAGQGKSALLAKLAEQLAGSPDLVITHFVGATERSADVRSLLERLNQELERSGIPWPAEDNPGYELEDLRKRLAVRLEGYQGDRRIVMLIDAVNQLTDGHDLTWLPQRLGRGVRLVVSCIDDPSLPADDSEARVLAALRDRRHEPEWVDLNPLEEGDVRQVVVDYLHEYCKELDREPIDIICRMEQARNPLYLLVMLNELRTLGGNDMNRLVPQLIARMKERYPDTVRLFDWVLERLEVFGREAVRSWCGYLALGRVGMTSRELSDLLARKLGPGAGRTALLIQRSLRHYLQSRGPQLDFFHGQLRQAVLARYVPADRTPLHLSLAEYFETRWREPDRHALVEWPYHLIQAGDGAGIHRLARSDFFDVQSDLLGVVVALLDARAVTEALVRAGDAAWDDLVHCAFLHCGLVERTRTDRRSLEGVIHQGKADAALALVASETDPKRKALLALAASVLSADAGQAGAVERLREAVAQVQPREYPFPQSCYVEALLRRSAATNLTTLSAEEPAADIARIGAGQPARRRVSGAFILAAHARAYHPGLMFLMLIGLFIGVTATIIGAEYGLGSLDLLPSWYTGNPGVVNTVRTVWVIGGLLFCLIGYPWAASIATHFLHQRGEALRGIMMGLVRAFEEAPPGRRPAILARALRFQALLLKAPESAENVNKPMTEPPRGNWADLLAPLVAETVANSPDPGEKAAWILRSIVPRVGAALKSALVAVLRREGTVGLQVLAVELARQTIHKEPWTLKEPGALFTEALEGCPAPGLARSILTLMESLPQPGWRVVLRTGARNFISSWLQPVVNPLGPLEPVLWLAVVVGLGLFALPGLAAVIAAFATGLAAVELFWFLPPWLLARCQDPVRLASVPWNDDLPAFGQALENQVSEWDAGVQKHDSANVGPIPASFPPHAVLDTVLAQRLLSHGLPKESLELFQSQGSGKTQTTVPWAEPVGGGARLFTPPRFRRVVLRMLTRGMWQRRGDVVLVALGNRRLLNEVAAVGKAATAPPRNFGPRDHAEQLRRVLPVGPTRRSVLLTAVVAGAATLLWSQAVVLAAPVQTAQVLQPFGTVLLIVLSLLLAGLQHVWRTPERTFRVLGLWYMGILFPFAGLGCLVATGLFHVAQLPWHLFYLLSFPYGTLLLTNLLVPLLISRWRGSHLFYPTVRQLWLQRLVWTGVFVAGCVIVWAITVAVSYFAVWRMSK